MDSTWSFVFNVEIHNFWQWSSMKLTKYCDPACDFVSTEHTSVCTMSSAAFHLIDCLNQKEVMFCLPAKQSVRFSSCTFVTSVMRLSSTSLHIPFWVPDKRTTHHGLSYGLMLRSQRTIPRPISGWSSSSNLPRVSSRRLAPFRLFRILAIL